MNERIYVRVFICMCYSLHFSCIVHLCISTKALTHMQFAFASSVAGGPMGGAKSLGINNYVSEMVVNVKELRARVRCIGRACLRSKLP